MAIIPFEILSKSSINRTTNYPRVKLAVLGESSTQFLVDAITGYGNFNNVLFDIIEVDFDQIELQVINKNSKIYLFNPDYIYINFSIFKLTKLYQKFDSANRHKFSDIILSNIENIISYIFSSSKARLIISNYPEFQDSINGNFFSKIEDSFLFQQRKINYKLMKKAQEIKNLFIVDINSIQSNVGRENFIDSKLYAISSIEYNLESISAIAKHLTDIIFSMNGIFAKCVILDLDNTIWGGIIGDDGLSGIKLGHDGIGKVFREFQRWIMQLKDRGIILAVCSKNQESTAKKPFERHPDMILKLEDISCFVANWNNKVDNINFIKNVLNISFNSMVFIDDNPFERNMVKSGIPELIVPDMPEDSSEYINYLSKNNFFETSTYSNKSFDRTIHYQLESKRILNQKKYGNEEEFLKSLGMCVKIEPFNQFNSSRISELSQRSNQFNLRTKRYTFSDIHVIIKSEKKVGFTLSLEDIFGKYGIISVVILEPFKDYIFIDTWIMSCRVLKRGVEKIAMNYIYEIAKSYNLNTIKGEYIMTPKNNLVKNHYKDLNFKKSDQNIWSLEISSFKYLENEINIKME